jgi:hypothetical protein
LGIDRETSVNRPNRLRASDARSALDGGEPDKAAAIALDVLEFNPGNTNALQIAVLARAMRGDHDSIFALLRQFERAGETRQRILKNAMVRARLVQQHDCAIAIAKQLFRVADRDPLVLADAVKTLGSAGAFETLHELSAGLSNPVDRAVVNTLTAVYEGALDRAVAELDNVPSAHALWDSAVQQVQTLAHVQRDEAVIYRLGREIVRTAKDLSRVPFWRNWEAAAVQGDRDEIRTLYLLAEAEMEKIFDDEDAFKRIWKSFAFWAFNAFDVATGTRILSLAFARGIADEAIRLTYQESKAFLQEFREEFELARANFRSIALGESTSFPDNELVRVVSLPKVMNLGNEHAVSTELAWLRVVGEVGRQVRKAGGAITFVQESAAPLLLSLEAPPPLILSYHTHGYAPSTLHFKEADLTEYFSLDPGGYAGWSSLASKSADALALQRFPADAVQAFFERYRRKIIDANHSKYAQGTSADPDPLPSRYVFVAMQVRFDTVQELARIPMLDMLDIVVRRFSGSPYRVVVKRHPRCTDVRVAKRLAQLSADGAIVLRNDSIHSLIAGAEAVITINSGVGSEAAIHMKPVYIFGAAEYAPIAHSISSEAEFAEKTSPIRLPVSEDTVRRFVYFYRNEFLLSIDDPLLRQQAVRQRVIEPALSASRARGPLRVRD